MHMTTFGDIFLMYRLGKEMSIEDLASASKIEPTVIQSIESSLYDPTEDEILKLEKALGLFPKELLTVHNRSKRTEEQTEITTEVNKRMKEARLYRKMLREEVALKLGVSKKIIIQFDEGHAVPTPELLKRFAEITNVPFDWLVGKNKAYYLGKKEKKPEIIESKEINIEILEQMVIDYISTKKYDDAQDAILLLVELSNQKQKAGDKNE